MNPYSVLMTVVDVGVFCRGNDEQTCVVCGAMLLLASLMQVFCANHKHLTSSRLPCPVCSRHKLALALQETHESVSLCLTATVATVATAPVELNRRL